MTSHPANPAHPVKTPWPRVRLGEVLRLEGPYHRRHLRLQATNRCPTSVQGIQFRAKLPGAPIKNGDPAGLSYGEVHLVARSTAKVGGSRHRSGIRSKVRRQQRLSAVPSWTNRSSTDVSSAGSCRHLRSAKQVRRASKAPPNYACNTPERMLSAAKSPPAPGRAAAGGGADRGTGRPNPRSPHPPPPSRRRSRGACRKSNQGAVRERSAIRLGELDGSATTSSTTATAVRRRRMTIARERRFSGWGTFRMVGWTPGI